jgi:hypothetical protein
LELCFSRAVEVELGVRVEVFEQYRVVQITVECERVAKVFRGQQGAFFVAASQIDS